LTCGFATGADHARATMNEPVACNSAGQPQAGSRGRRVSGAPSPPPPRPGRDAQARREPPRRPAAGGVSVQGLAQYQDLVFGGWDLNGADLAAAASQHRVLNDNQLDEVAPALSKLRPGRRWAAASSAATWTAPTSARPPVTAPPSPPS
jgi:hypothetical protein